MREVQEPGVEQLGQSRGLNKRRDPTSHPALAGLTFGIRDKSGTSDPPIRHRPFAESLLPGLVFAKSFPRPAEDLDPCHKPGFPSLMSWTLNLNESDKKEKLVQQGVGELVERFDARNGIILQTPETCPGDCG